MKSLIKEFDKERELAKTKEIERASGDIINRIFKALKLIFPAWRQAIESDNELDQIKKMWLKTLIDEKITTQEQISLGLKGARNHDSPFFPSIGQFIKWTKKEKPRVNEQAYQSYQHQLAPYTEAEYKEMGRRGIEKLKKVIN